MGEVTAGGDNESKYTEKLNDTQTLMKPPEIPRTLTMTEGSFSMQYELFVIPQVYIISKFRCSMLIAHLSQIVAG